MLGGFLSGLGMFGLGWMLCCEFYCFEFFHFLSDISGEVVDEMETSAD